MYLPTSRRGPSRLASMSPLRLPASQSNSRYTRSPTILASPWPCFHWSGVSPGMVGSAAPFQRLDHSPSSVPRRSLASTAFHGFAFSSAGGSSRALLRANCVTSSSLGFGTSMTPNGFRIAGSLTDTTFPVAISEFIDASNCDGLLRSERHGRLRERCDRRMEAWRPPDFRENPAGYVEPLRRAMIRRRSQGLRNVGSGNVGLRARRLLGEQGVEIDELRIVSLGFAEPCAAMKMHQGLHAAGVEMVHMLMLQRDRQQRLGEPDQRKGRNPAHFVALAPEQGMEGVDQLPIDLCRWQLLRFG